MLFFQFWQSHSSYLALMTYRPPRKALTEEEPITIPSARAPTRMMKFLVALTFTFCRPPVLLLVLESRRQLDDDRQAVKGPCCSRRQDKLDGRYWPS